MDPNPIQQRPPSRFSLHDPRAVLDVGSAPVVTAPRAPLFTVVIPTYRRDRLLAEALDSVLTQTFGDFEVLVVDDAGRTETRNLVETYAVWDARVRYLVNDRAKGGAGARNCGIERARGAWISFLDDDDVWLPERLARHLDVIDRGGAELGLVYSAFEVYDFDEGTTLDIVRPQRSGWVRESFFDGNWLGGFFNVSIRRDALLAVGGLDERFPAWQDLDLYLRVSEKWTADGTDVPLVRVRYHGGSRITTDEEKRHTAARLFYRKYAADLTHRPAARHRIALRILCRAIGTGAYASMWRALPWGIGGVVHDWGNRDRLVRVLPKAIRSRVGHLIRQRLLDPSALRIRRSAEGARAPRVAAGTLLAHWIRWRARCRRRRLVAPPGGAARPPPRHNHVTDG